MLHHFLVLHMLFRETEFFDVSLLRFIFLENLNYHCPGDSFKYTRAILESKFPKTCKIKTHEVERIYTVRNNDTQD